MKILLLGDIVGRSGIDTVLRYLLQNSSEYDFIIVNGENAAAGFGLTPEIVEELLFAGVDVITSGNHIWKNDTIIPILNLPDSVVLRPANYPSDKAGHGQITLNINGFIVQVINLHGKVFTDFSGASPFKTIDRILQETTADCRIIDIHAEATSEKLALAHYVDGRVKVVVGTHTHVQTADAKILPGGTAYISDLGMCGSDNGVIGMEAKCSIGRFLSDRYSKPIVAEGNDMINGLSVTLDDSFAVMDLRRIYEAI